MIKLKDLTPAERIEFYRTIGRKGGLARVKKGFALSGKAREAGRKGGLVSQKTNSP